MKMETDKNQNKPKKPVRNQKTKSEKPMPKSTRTDMLKKQTIDALEKSLGIVTIACRNVGIHRSTFYDWINNDPEFKKLVDDVSEITLDFAESELHKQIRDGSTAATIFYLKTKGKKRGFIERSEIDMNTNSPDFSGLTTQQIIDMLNEPDPDE